MQSMARNPERIPANVQAAITSAHVNRMPQILVLRSLRLMRQTVKWARTAGAPYREISLKGFAYLENCQNIQEDTLTSYTISTVSLRSAYQDRVVSRATAKAERSSALHTTDTTNADIW